MRQMNGTIFDLPTSLAPVGAVCIPVACELLAEELVMAQGYALQAKARWPSLPRAAGYFTKMVGHRTHLVTYVENGVFRVHGSGAVARQAALTHHLFTLPTRPSWKGGPSLERIVKSVRELKHIVEHKHIEGTIVFPGLGQNAELIPALFAAIDAWIPEDRYVMLVGNKGTPS